SRRRHTRFSRDWSSDVCSSDLLATRTAEDSGDRPPASLTFVVDISGSMAEPGRLDLAKSSLATMTDRLRDDDAVALVTFSDEARSEERRVGEEGRCRWRAYQ